MHRPVYSSLSRSSGRITTLSSLQSRRSFSRVPTLSLWGGATVPYENQRIPMPPSPGPQPAMPMVQARSESERIERIHKEFVEDLLSRAASSANGLDTFSTPRATKPASKKGRSRNRRHSMSEPTLFRTDGPLTPYPIELDSGELLEPKHATLVRITDKQGQERKIVVAEVEEESGKQRRVLLAVDMDEYSEAGSTDAVPARKITAEDMYATLGLEAQGVRS